MLHHLVAAKDPEKATTNQEKPSPDLLQAANAMVLCKPLRSADYSAYLNSWAFRSNRLTYYGWVTKTKVRILASELFLTRIGVSCIWWTDIIAIVKLVFLTVAGARLFTGEYKKVFFFKKGEWWYYLAKETVARTQTEKHDYSECNSTTT